MKTLKNINDELSGFNGSQTIFKHPFGFCYTEGVQYLVSNFKCYWLIEKIFSHSITNSALLNQPFQTWKLERIGESVAFSLTAEDGNYNQLYQTRIPYSDFEGGQVTIWFIDGIMLLPSEY